MDLLARALGSLPDAAWIRRQFTLDADVVHDAAHARRGCCSRHPGFTAIALLVFALGLARRRRSSAWPTRCSCVAAGAAAGARHDGLAVQPRHRRDAAGCRAGQRHRLDQAGPVVRGGRHGRAVAVSTPTIAGREPEYLDGRARERAVFHACSARRCSTAGRFCHRNTSEVADAWRFSATPCGGTVRRRRVHHRSGRASQ